jgi:hypothetical protein
MMLQVGVVRGALMAFVLAAFMLTAPSLPGQHAPRATAADVAVGMSSTRGPEIAQSDAFALDLTFLRTSRRFARVGGAMGIRSGSGNGDVCVFASRESTRCLPNLGSRLELLALGGVGISDESGELRLLAGPLLVAGDGTPAFGGALAADGALGVRTVLLVFGVRASTAYRSHGGRLTSQQWTLGIRFRY